MWAAAVVAGPAVIGAAASNIQVSLSPAPTVESKSIEKGWKDGVELAGGATCG